MGRNSAANSFLEWLANISVCYAKSILYAKEKYMNRKMRMTVSFVLIVSSLLFTAMAHAGTRNVALEMLQCNWPYKHTVSPKAMQAWEEGDEKVFAYMDITKAANKRGINKYAAAVQMFQKLYCPDDPMFMDTVEGRHLLDEFLMEGKLIPRIYHVIPSKDEMDREEAWNMALNEIKTEYNLNFAGLMRNMAVDIHYFSPTGKEKDAFWLFHARLENGDKYAIRVKDGQVDDCLRLEKEEALFEAYVKRCDEKGAFFTWPPEDKANYAKQLPDAILSAYMEGQDLSRCGDLLVIARQGFTLPANGVMGQAEALEKAKQAVESAFAPPDGWDHDATIYYSLYKLEDRMIWRVIFWKTGFQELPGAVVDMDSQTGRAFRAERYEGTPESIPYAERL